jgi:carbamoyl-phosphate synthase large subunit
MSMDKWSTFQTLTQYGIPTALTFEGTERERAEKNLGYPLMVKARYSDMKASGDYIIQRVNNPRELNEIREKINGKETQYVLQEFLPGTELTVDFFCGRDGKLVSAVPGERLSALSKAFSKDGGAIDQGRTFHDPSITAILRKAAEHISFRGAANFQGYRGQQGEVKIIEINPRFSGATVMTKGAGHDYFQWNIDLAAGKEIPAPPEDFRDVCMSSWLNPIFFQDVAIRDLN